MMKVRVDELHMMQTDSQWTSSKGNQNKWFYKGAWYKEDGLGYEALAEVVISRLLKKTNVDTFVKYHYAEVQKGDRCCHGCGSLNFMEPEDDKLISVERLFQAFRGESASKAVLAFPDVKDRIRFVVDAVEQTTGLKNFGVYLKKILTIDTLFFNEDRHFHNLAVIRRHDGTYRECPIFDNGASLFSDIRGDYPLALDLDQCLEKIQAKPFSTDFDEQLDACDILYGGYAFQAAFTMEDVEAVLQEFQGIYADGVLERIRKILRRQIRKYQYLFL